MTFLIGIVVASVRNNKGSRRQTTFVLLICCHCRELFALVFVLFFSSGQLLSCRSLPQSYCLFSFGLYLCCDGKQSGGTTKNNSRDLHSSCVSEKSALLQYKPPAAFSFLPILALFFMLLVAAFPRFSPAPSLLSRVLFIFCLVQLSRFFPCFFFFFCVFVHFTGILRHVTAKEKKESSSLSFIWPPLVCSIASWRFSTGTVFTQTARAHSASQPSVCLGKLLLSYSLGKFRGSPRSLSMDWSVS